MNTNIIRKLLVILSKPRVINRIGFFLEGKNTIYKNTIITNAKNSCNNFFKCSNSSFVHCDIYYGGSNNTIEIGDYSRFDFVSITCLGDNNYIKIGSNSMIMKNGILHCANGGKIIIGNNFLCSINVTIRNNDGHYILDKFSKIINYGPYNLYVGNNVWVCQNAIILKKARINDNTVVGANTLLDKSFEESNVIIVGSPARVIKKEINWIR